MKGLVLKDFYMGKRFVILGTAGFFMMVVLSYLLRFAYIHGNLAMLDAPAIEDGIKTTDFSFTVLPGLVLLFLFVQAVTASVYADAKAGWNQYLFSSGLSEKQIVLAKYMEFIGLWIIGILFTLLFSAIYGGIFGFSNVKSGIYSFFLAAFLVAVCQCIMIPLAYRYQNENAVVGRTFIAFLLPGYLITGVFAVNGIIDPADFDSSRISVWCKNHIAAMMAGAVLVLLAAVMISYGMSLKIVRRREVICRDCC